MTRTRYETARNAFGARVPSPFAYDRFAPRDFHDTSPGLDWFGLLNGVKQTLNLAARTTVLTTAGFEPTAVPYSMLADVYPYEPTVVLNNLGGVFDPAHLTVEHTLFGRTLFGMAVQTFIPLNAEFLRDFRSAWRSTLIPTYEAQRRRGGATNLAEHIRHGVLASEYSPILRRDTATIIADSISEFVYRLGDEVSMEIMTHNFYDNAHIFDTTAKNLGLFLTFITTHQP